MARYGLAHTFAGFWAAHASAVRRTATTTDVPTGIAEVWAH
jgi:hypothetical protein